MSKSSINNMSTFGKAMLLYFCIGMLVVVVGVRWLSQFVVENDKSQAKYIVEKYVSEFGTENIRAAAKDTVSGLDRNIESEEESYSEIEKYFEGEISYVKQSSQSTSNDYLYVITLDGVKIGELHVVTDTDMTKILKIPEWRIGSEEIEIPDLRKTASVTVPNTWTVYFNGALLGSSYVTETGIRYPQIKTMYDKYDNLPCMLTYSVSNYLGDHEFSFTDASGNPVEYTDDLDAIQERELNNCSEADRQRITDFCTEFVKRLVILNSNQGQGYFANVDSMRQLLVVGTEYYNSIGKAADSMVYTIPKNETVQQVTVNRILTIGEGTWSVDLTYILQSGYDNVKVITSNHLQLTVVSSGSGILADGVLIYPAETVS